MLYAAYQLQSDFGVPFRALARLAGDSLRRLSFLADGVPARNLAATWELIGRLRLTHERPAYGIPSVLQGNRELPVVEEPVLRTPFGTLLRFRKEGAPEQPRVLVVAPLSGHFATLLRSTLRTLLQDHDVYVTDWHNARDVPLSAGPFGFDDYVAHVIAFLEHLGPGTHLLAVCQPCVQVLAAAAVMAAENNPAQPRSMTLMAGPVDVRINPTQVNRLATEKPIEWFSRSVVDRVPPRHPGAGRRVYPGFLQLTAFLSMNLERHIKAHGDLHRHVVDGETDKAAAIRSFYDEYCAVLDLPAEFYLETVQWVFQEARLAAGTLTYRGRPVDPAAIRRTALLTVEGERDDICGLGQTAAAHDLCTGLRPWLKRHHLQAGVGHYGVFSGRRWENQIYPLVRNLILAVE